jgi:hypothetical protein
VVQAGWWISGRRLRTRLPWSGWDDYRLRRRRDDDDDDDYRLRAYRSPLARSFSCWFTYLLFRARARRPTRERACARRCPPPAVHMVDRYANGGALHRAADKPLKRYRPRSRRNGRSAAVELLNYDLTCIPCYAPGAYARPSRRGAARFRGEKYRKTKNLILENYLYL